MDYQALLSEIESRAAKAEALGNTLKFDIGDGDVIFLDGSGDKNVVSSENKEADCTIKITKENFGKLMDGSLNPMMAFMGGKVKVDGDLGVAMKLQSLV